MLVDSKITLQTSYGETVFMVRQLNAVASLHLLNRLQKAVGPGLASAMGGKGEPGRVVGLLGAIDSDLIDHLIQKLLVGSTVIAKGEANAVSLDLIDVAFAGHLSQLLELLAHALRVNYSAFFQDLPGLLQRLTGKVTAA